jgi:hypothetical protein
MRITKYDVEERPNCIMSISGLMKVRQFVRKIQGRVATLAKWLSPKFTYYFLLKEVKSGYNEGIWKVFVNSETEQTYTFL